MFRLAALALCSALASIGISFQDGQAPDAAYRGTRDVSLDDGADEDWNPDANYQSTNLENDSNPKKCSLLSFDVSSLASTVTVTSVSLQLWVSNPSNDAYPVYAMSTPWVANQADWWDARSGVPWSAPGATGAADHGTTVIAYVDAGVNGANTVAFNAAGIAAVQTWVAGTNNGVTVQDYSFSDGLDISNVSDTTVSERAALVIGYSDALGPHTVTFQNGVSPTAAYQGASGTTLANGPNQELINNNGGDLLADGKDTPVSSGMLLQFDVSAIPPWATVQSAALSFVVSNASVQAWPVFPMLVPWSETQASWLMRDATNFWADAGASGTADHDPTVILTVPPTAVGAQSYAFNDAGIAWIQSWVSGASGNNGITLQNYSNTDGLGFYDRENATVSNRPKLSVTYDEGQFALVSGPDGGPAGSILGPYRFQRQQLSGTPIGAPGGFTPPTLAAGLSSSSPSGTFALSPAGPWSTSIALTFPSGGSVAPDVYYGDTQPGRPTLLLDGGPAWIPALVIPSISGSSDGGGGASDGGTGNPHLLVGCGCGATDAVPLSLLALGLLNRRRRRD